MNEHDDRPWLRPNACVRDGDGYTVQTPRGVYRLRLGSSDVGGARLATCPPWEVIAPHGGIIDEARALHMAVRRAWEHAEAKP